MAIQMNITFDHAMAIKVMREMEHDATAMRLRAVSGDEKGPFGLTPDHIKSTPEWKQAFANERAAFHNMRSWNQYMSKYFKKEIREHSDKKRQEKLAAISKGN